MLLAITAVLVIVSFHATFAMACYYTYAAVGEVSSKPRRRLALPVNIVPAVEYVGLTLAIFCLAVGVMKVAAVGVDLIMLGVVLRWRGAKPEISRLFDLGALGLAAVSLAFVILIKVLCALSIL